MTPGIVQQRTKGWKTVSHCPFLRAARSLTLALSPTHRNVVHTSLRSTVLTLGLTHDRVLAPTTALHIRVRVDAFPSDGLAHGEGRHVGRVTCLQTGGAESFTESGLLGEGSSSRRGDTRDALLSGGDAERGTAEGEAGVAG
jgi:hypothetical protein